MLLNKKSVDKEIRKDVFYKFTVLARYLYNVEEKKPKAIRAELTALAERLDQKYDYSYWDDIITKILNGKYKKKPIIDIQGVGISQAELSRIGEIESLDKQKILFTLLCLAKYKNIYTDGESDGWINIGTQDLFRLANSKVTSSKRRLDIIRSLYVGEYIGLSRKITNPSIHVEIIHGDDIAFAIDDFRDLGYQYEKYIGNEFNNCCVCGRLVKPDGKYKKYCCDCHDKYYNPLGDYYYIPIAQRPIKVKCNCCGNDMLQNPELFWLDSVCPKCLAERSGKSAEE